MQSAAGSNPDHELKAIRDGSLRGSEIVRELMVYAGKELVIWNRSTFSQIIREMELLKSSISNHIVLEADLARDLAPLQANAAQVRQIVMNLGINASDRRSSCSDPGDLKKQDSKRRMVDHLGKRCLTCSPHWRCHPKDWRIRPRLAAKKRLFRHAVVGLFPIRL